MSPASIMCGLLIAIGVAALAAAGEPYHESALPRGLSEWKESRDEKISICFVVDKTTFAGKDKLSVRCALRNNSDKPLTVLRPFGDSYYAISEGLRIVGPEGSIAYRGAVKDYVLGTSSFVELPPRHVIDETFELPPDKLPGLGEPGLYMVSYHFQSGGYPKQPPPDNFWSGEIRAERLWLLIK